MGSPNNSRAFGSHGGKVGPATLNWSDEDDENYNFGLPPSGAIAVQDGVFSNDDEAERPDSSTVNEMHVDDEESGVGSDDVEDEGDATSEDSSNTDDSATSSLLVDKFDLCGEVEQTPVRAVPCETGCVDEYRSGQRESSVGFEDIERFIHDDSTAAQSFEEAIALAASQEAGFLYPLDDDWLVTPSDDQPGDVQIAGVEPKMRESIPMTLATASEIDGSGNVMFGQMDGTPVEEHYIAVDAPEGIAEATPSTSVDTHDIGISDSWMRVAEDIAETWGVVESPAGEYDLYLSSNSLISTTLSDELNTDLSVNSDLDDLFQEEVEFLVDPLATDTEPSIEVEPSNPEPVFDEDPSLAAGVDDWDWIINGLTDTEPCDEAVPNVHLPEQEGPVNDEQDNFFIDTEPFHVQWDRLQFPISKRSEPAEVEYHPKTNVEHVRSDIVEDEVEAPRNDPPAPPGTPEPMRRPELFESKRERHRFWATWYRFRAINKRRVAKDARKLDISIRKRGLLWQIHNQGSLSSRDAAEALDDEQKLLAIEQLDATREEAERRDLEQRIRNRASVEASRRRKEQMMEELALLRDTQNRENGILEKMLEEVEMAGMSIGTWAQEGQDGGNMPQLSLGVRRIAIGILAAEQNMHAPMHQPGNSNPQISDGIPGSSREHAERGKKRLRYTDYESDEDDPRPNKEPRNE